MEFARLASLQDAVLQTINNPVVSLAGPRSTTGYKLSCLRHEESACEATENSAAPIFVFHPSVMNTTTISRRNMLKGGLLGAAGLCLSNNAALRALAAAAQTQTPPPRAKAKSVIQIWLAGGPPHLDTFDPKPGAGSDYCGPFSTPIETNVRGIKICELLPLLAKQADKYSIIRGMTHGSDAHETATYMMQTGRAPGGRLVFPCYGAVVSLFKGHGGGYQGQLPPYIALTEPLGRFDEAGFLGTRYRPFATGGDPAQDRFIVEGIVAEGISRERQLGRRDLLGKLDTLGDGLPGTPALKAFARSRDQAYDMIVGDGAKIFDLSTENEALRDRYGSGATTQTPQQASGKAPATQQAPGKAPATQRQAATGRRTTFGQCCLVARRLVESGVPFVTIKSPGWDTHKDHFNEMRRKLRELDQGLATLLQDLSERGLLESTIVWCGGEFGRTPRVLTEAPWNGGRGHWGKAFSVIVAGGGFKGGQVVGATDAKGEEVKDRPVYPADLIGSVYGLLGIAPDARLPNPEGMDIRATPAPAENVPSNGLLREIT